MSDDSAGEKTEKPTPKRMQELREKGEVAKSRELPSVAVLFCSLIALTLFGSYMYTQVQFIMKGAFSFPLLNDPTISKLLVFAQEVTTRFILAMSPLFAAIFVTAIFSNIIQVGFLLSAESIVPKLSKIDPIKGFERLFSKQSLMELFKSLLKLAIVGSVAYYTIKVEIQHVTILGEMELNSISSYILKGFFRIFAKCTLAMIFIVIIDYVFQRWDFENRNKMSKQDIKDEFKKAEGDPLIKSRIKSIQMEMSRKRMMQAVPDADVVITNPTRLAVAIKYDHATMNAPKVIAKGSGKIAEKIRTLAKEHDIAILEKKELAQSLYKLTEIGQEIPPNFYQAVAEVLAYIYKLKGKLAHSL